MPTVQPATAFVKGRDVTHLVPLECLNRGEVATIAEIEGEQEILVRLREMGLREGVRVRMIQPGCPCILSVGDHRLCFRAEECGAILVEIHSA